MTLFSTILMTLLALYLIAVQPFLGKRSYERLLRDVAADPRARLRYFRRIVVTQWGLVLAVGLMFALRRAPLADLGFRLPKFELFSLAASFGLVVGLLFSIALGAVSTKYRAKIRAQLKPAEGLLPTTPAERRWYAAVALTAGLCEEVLYRGFLIYYIVQIAAPFSPLVVAGLLAAVLFGLAHLYQGLRGILSAGLLGLFFVGIYLFTGSLLFPMAIHALTDLRVLPLLAMTSSDDNRQSA